VDDLGATVTVAAGVFAVTNIDDIIVLTVLFLTSRSIGQPRPWQIVAGQYLGIGLLVALSVVAAAGLLIIPDQWVGLLGLFPIALGVRGLWRAHSHNGEDAPAVAVSLLAVAGVTIANGADNVSVYTPMFRTLRPGAGLITVAVFAAGVALWCVTGAWLGSHKKVIATVERVGHWLVPVVFITIGTVILIQSGVTTGLF
jgi:cadmium resistance protein CadD (predicted permease)